MKIELLDDNIIIFLNKHIVKDIDYENIEKDLKNIFGRLSCYGIKVGGYYDIYAYIDDNYGVILECIKDSLSYEDSVLDIRLILKKTNFLYQVDDIIPCNHNVYFYKSNLYIELMEDIDISEYVKKIIYKDIDKIKKNRLVR